MPAVIDRQYSQSDMPAKKKHGKRRSRDESIKREEPTKDSAGSYSQDVVESSQQHQVSKRKNRPRKQNCETNTAVEPQDELRLESTEGSSRDDDAVEEVKKKTKRKRRAERSSKNKSNDIIANENTNYQSHEEAGDVDLKEAANVKRKNTSSTSLTDFFSPLKKQRLSRCGISDVSFEHGERMKPDEFPARIPKVKLEVSEEEERMPEKKQGVERKGKGSNSSESDDELKKFAAVKSRDKSNVKKKGDSRVGRTMITNEEEEECQSSDQKLHSNSSSSPKRGETLPTYKNNTLLSMIRDCSNSSESDDENDEISDRSAKSVGNTNLRERREATLLRYIATSDEEEDNETSDRKPVENSSSLVKREETPELRGVIKTEKTSTEAGSSSESGSISAKVSTSKSKRSSRDSESEGKQIFESKSLLSMIHDRSDSSESDDENEKSARGSSSKNHTSEENRSKTRSDSFNHEQTIKREQLSTDTDSSSGSISHSEVFQGPKSMLSRPNGNDERNHHAVDKKSSNTFRMMTSDSSETEDEEDRVADSSARTSNKRNLKRSSGSRVGKTIKTNGTQEERQSSSTKEVKNYVPLSKSCKTLDDYWSKPKKTDSNSSKSESDNRNVRETVSIDDNPRGDSLDISQKDTTSDGAEQNRERKAHPKSVKTRSNTLLSIIDDDSSDSDRNDERVKIEADDSDDSANTMNPRSRIKSEDSTSDKTEQNRERKAHKKSVKTGSNTLLSIIDDESSNSDRNDEGVKIKDDDSDDSENTTNRRRIKSEVKYADMSSDDSDGSQSSDNKSVLRRKKIRKFDLEAEAQDVEHMIRVLEEEEVVPKDSLKKLRALDVRLQHKVPPQHMVETCAGSRGPTHRQKDIIEKFGPIKYGKYSPEEDDTIVKNWKSFCKVHNWDKRDVKPFLYMRHQHDGFVAKLSQRQKFVQYLANGLPWRTLYSVYWRFRNLYQPHIATRYTEDEDKLIIAHMENSSSNDTRNVRKFSELAKILNRTRASVWRRYRLLNKKRDCDQKPKYDLHLAKKMIKHLIQLTLVKDVSGLKDLDVPIAVWNKLSKKFGIDNENLKRFWLGKLHMQLFCKDPIYLNDVKIKMIEYFNASDITEWRDIEWGNIVKYFDGMTSMFISQVFNNLIKEEKLEGKELSETLTHLYEVKKPELQKAHTDKCLPRLSYKYGSLRLLDTDRKGDH